MHRSPRLTVCATCEETRDPRRTCGPEGGEPCLAPGERSEPPDRPDTHTPPAPKGSNGARTNLVGAGLAPARNIVCTRPAYSGDREGRPYRRIERVPMVHDGVPGRPAAPPCAIRPLKRGRCYGSRMETPGSLRSPGAKHGWTPSGPLVLGEQATRRRRIHEPRTGHEPRRVHGQTPHAPGA